MGIVIETGSGVSLLKKGDRVVMPFNVADGRCRNCEEGKTAFCTGVNPGFAGGAYGYVSMGPYEGGQAQYLRVPFADFNSHFWRTSSLRGGMVWFSLDSNRENLLLFLALVP
jgi:threonine dehydrogenase-like Zn-dependent dehydrogenase